MIYFKPVILCRIFLLPNIFAYMAVNMPGKLLNYFLKQPTNWNLNKAGILPMYHKGLLSYYYLHIPVFPDIPTAYININVVSCFEVSQLKTKGTERHRKENKGDKSQQYFTVFFTLILQSLPHSNKERE